MTCRTSLYRFEIKQCCICDQKRYETGPNGKIARELFRYYRVRYVSAADWGGVADCRHQAELVTGKAVTVPAPSPLFLDKYVECFSLPMTL